MLAPSGFGSLLGLEETWGPEADPADPDAQVYHVMEDFDMGVGMPD